jgi:hypothetical protein
MMGKNRPVVASKISKRKCDGSEEEGQNAPEPVQTIKYEERKPSPGDGDALDLKELLNKISGTKESEHDKETVNPTW